MVTWASFPSRAPPYIVAPQAETTGAELQAGALPHGEGRPIKMGTSVNIHRRKCSLNQRKSNKIWDLSKKNWILQRKTGGRRACG